MADVEIVGQAELRDLARRLRAQEDYKPRIARLRKDLRQAAQPIAAQIRNNARGLPSKGQNRMRGRKTLRSDLARSVTVQVRTNGRRAGVAVYMNPRKMGDGRKNLTQYWEKTRGYNTLTHPVFGRGRTIQVTPPAGYFTRALGPAAREAEAAVRRVIDETARRIES